MSRIGYRASQTRVWRPQQSGTPIGCFPSTHSRGPRRTIGEERRGGRTSPTCRREARALLTHDQVQALAEACAPYGTLIKVLAYAGLRWGELVTLTTRRVSLKRRRIEVVEAITEVHGRVIVDTAKTHQRRLVPVPRFLADGLAVDLATKAAGDLVFSAPKAVCCGTPIPAAVLRSGCREGRTAWTDAARAPPHRSQPCYSRRRQRQSGAAYARARLRRHDPRHLCGPFRR
jgi:integrase